MNPKEILDSLINRVNKNPMNQKKIYFTFTEIVEIDKSVSFEIRFGISKNNSIFFKEYLQEGADKEKTINRLYATVIDEVFSSIYDRMDSDTFSDNVFSNIVRVEKNHIQ